MTNFQRRHQAASGAKAGQYVPCTAELQCTLANSDHISGIVFEATKQWLGRDGVRITNADVSPEEVERFRRSEDYLDYVDEADRKKEAQKAAGGEIKELPARSLVAVGSLRKGDVVVFSDGNGYTSPKRVKGVQNNDGVNVRVSYVDDSNPSGMVLSTTIWHTTPINRLEKKSTGKGTPFAPGKPAHEVVGASNAKLLAELADKRARSANNRASGAASRKAMNDFFNGSAPAAKKDAAPAAPRTSHEELSEMMDLGRVIQVAPNGAFPALNGLGLSTAPEEIQYVDLDADGGAPDPVAPKGWEYLKGFTGQHGYHGSVMHASESMGGGLADHILDNPGFYAVVEIDVWPEDESTDAEPVGWGVLRYVGTAE